MSAFKNIDRPLRAQSTQSRFEKAAVQDNSITSDLSPSYSSHCQTLMPPAAKADNPTVFSSDLSDAARKAEKRLFPLTPYVEGC